MSDPSVSFRYVAVTAAGQRTRGVIAAGDEAAAFDRLRRDGLAPLRLTRARSALAPRRKNPLGDADTAELLGSLADLLKAGADMRTSLEVLGSRAAKPSVAAVCRGLSDDIAGGGALDLAFATHMHRHRDFVAAMVAAAEASGDLSAGLARAAQMIEARLKLRDKLVAVLAYPGFVLVSTLAAVLALLLFVIPALAPLTQASEAPPPPALAGMIWTSDLIREHLALIGGGLAGLTALALAAARAGLLGRLADRLLLDGPLRRTARGFVFGGFAITLGGMLASGAPMSEALRLASRSVGSPLARARLEPVVQSVRQGQSLSVALDAVGGFPGAISRLAMVGEATGALGPMLARAGVLEEESTMKRIETIGQILGPALIVGLGGLVGLLMASLLSGVSQLGDAALA
jgi:type II secretory pathway component PulF